jgi:PKD repeat protein
MRRVRRLTAGLLAVAGLVVAPAAQAQDWPATSSLALDVPPPWLTYGNAQPAATFDQPASNAFTVSAAGADLWRATDEYGVVYLPDATPEHFEAVVKVPSFTGTHNASKAGIMVRNDVTQPTVSTGYLVLSRKGDGEAEFLHDAGGNGQVNDEGEPVAVGCGKVKTPMWLKVRKVDAAFTAWCSRDGIGWTQLGGPIAIPSAEAAQDIGMFVSSHVANTHATAEFTDWSVTTVDPDPAPPAPDCVPDRSDEFDGDAIDERWTTVRGAPTVGGGSATLPITQGDIDGGNAGAISYLGQPAPGQPWTATTKVTLEQDNEWQFAGLLLHVDDSNYTKVSFTKHSNDSRFFEFWSETGGTRTGHGPNVTVPAETGNTVYLRMVSNGTTLTAHYSLDGETFTQIGSAAPLKTGAEIGPVAAGDTDAPNQVAAFDWFRLTPDGPRGFDDEFDGSALDGCRWDRIHNWDGDNLAVADGKLTITTFDADIDGPNNRAIQNLIMQAPPAGDWTVETKVTAPLNDTWQLAGFMLYEDDDHYVKYDVVADNEAADPRARRTELRYEDGGPLTGPVDVGPDEAPPASPTDTWYLRLTKTGDTYTGAIRVEDGTWHRTPGSVTVALDDPALGLMAIGPDQDGEPIDVSFDYIKVVQNAAPLITAATATPDGGKVPLPVQFSATATDADGDEPSYSWDFGNGGTTEDATTKDATFTYTTPGTYTAKVTVSDGKLTDSETVTVAVAPNAAPVIASAAATPSAGKAPLPVTLAAEATDGDGDDLTYSWDFGDGDAIENATAQVDHTYATPGTYTAEVTVWDGRATDTETVAVTVKANTPPVLSAATATPNTGDAPLAVQFGAAATDADGDTLTYSWDFGNGGSTQDATTRNAAFTYPAPGTYTARVTVSDGESSDSEPVVVTVRPAPINQAPTVVASADPAGGAAPLTVAFSATGQDAEGDALTYAWSFGDGASAAGATATHTFAQAGSYAVTVTVKDAKGNTGSAALTVVVDAAPGASGKPPRAAIRAAAPASIKAFARRGVKVAVACTSAGRGKLSARVGKRVAKRLGLRGRVLASATVRCVGGKTVSVRVKPSRKVRKALTRSRAKSLKLKLVLAVPGQDAVRRTITVRR